MSRTVLIVDDAEFMRDLLCRVLMEEGYRVLWAPNAGRAWSLLERDAADLVLLDLNLPKLGALDFLRVLKGLRDWRHVPVMVLTDDSQPQLRERAMRLGAMDFIVKSEDLPRQVSEKMSLHFAANQSPQNDARPSLLF